MMDLSVMWQVLATVATAGAIYGGIRADLLHMRESLDHADRSVRRAHERIDRHVETFHAE